MEKGSEPILSGGAASRERLGRSRLAVYGILVCTIVWLLFRGGAKTSDEPREIDALWDDWSAIREIYAFGDSWTTTEFDVDGPQPNEKNPLGNPAFPNDPNKKTPDWITYLTGSYNESFIRTYNLARGAATIDREVVAPVFSFTQTLREQVYDTYMSRYAFSKHGSDPWPPRNRLVIVFFGLVDISLLSRNISTDLAVVEDLARSYEDALHKLHAAGIRHFLLLAAPPLDMAPSPDNLDLLAALLRAFNARLARLAARFRAAHPDAALRLFDLHRLLVRLMHDPASLPQTAGIQNVTRACWSYNPDMYIQSPQHWSHFDPECGIARDEYFWANGLHLTHPVQEAIAAMIVGECFGQPRHGWGICS